MTDPVPRAQRRTLLYSAFLLLPAVVVLFFAVAALDAPGWAFALLGCIEGQVAVKLGRWLAQRREATLP